VAYTVSLYRATHGARKDQPTVPLNISFAVVLYDGLLDSKDSDGGGDEQEDDDDNRASSDEAEGLRVKEEEDQRDV